MKNIETKQVYIRKEFAQEAKLIAAIKGKKLQEVLDEILSAHFAKHEVNVNG